MTRQAVSAGVPYRQPWVTIEDRLAQLLASDHAEIAGAHNVAGGAGDTHAQLPVEELAATRAAIRYRLCCYGVARRRRTNIRPPRAVGAEAHTSPSRRQNVLSSDSVR